MTDSQNILNQTCSALSNPGVPQPAFLRPARLPLSRTVLKFEIAQELGLDKKVLEQGWRSLTAKESGRIGGIMTRKKRELKAEVLKERDSEG